MTTLQNPDQGPEVYPNRREILYHHPARPSHTGAVDIGIVSRIEEPLSFRPFYDDLDSKDDLHIKNRLIPPQTTIHGFEILIIGDEIRYVEARPGRADKYLLSINYERGQVEVVSRECAVIAKSDSQYLNFAEDDVVLGVRSVIGEPEAKFDFADDDPRFDLLEKCREATTEFRNEAERRKTGGFLKKLVMGRKRI